MIVYCYGKSVRLTVRPSDTNRGLTQFLTGKVSKHVGLARATAVSGPSPDCGRLSQFTCALAGCSLSPSLFFPTPATSRAYTKARRSVYIALYIQISMTKATAVKQSSLPWASWIRAMFVILSCCLASCFLPASVTNHSKYSISTNP